MSEPADTILLSDAGREARTQYAELEHRTSSMVQACQRWEGNYFAAQALLDSCGAFLSNCPDMGADYEAEQWSDLRQMCRDLEGAYDE